MALRVKKPPRIHGNEGSDPGPAQGIRIRHCCTLMQLGASIAVLWGRQTCAARIGPLAWELAYGAG